MAKADQTKRLLRRLLSDLEAEISIRQRLERRESFLLGADECFLGRIAGADEPESVSNPAGPYGNVDSPTSVHNLRSAYGSPHGALSLRNPHTATPPLLFVNGEFWGLVSNNGTLEGRLIDAEQFLRMIASDWRSFVQSRFSDSGSLPISAAT